MEYGGVIGFVVGYGEGRWEWIIPDFSSLPRMADGFFLSPDFDAEGERWYLQMHPNGIGGDIPITIQLCRRSFSEGKYFSCTVGVKRADRSEETIGTKTNSGARYWYVFSRTRRELENGDWFSEGGLIVTCLIGRAHASQANRRVTSRENHTDVLDAKMGKNERLEDCKCTRAQGVSRLSENVKALLTEENDDYDVTIVVKEKEFRAHRLILKARSPVLGMMLTHDSKEKNSGTIHIEDCDPDCFGEFLLFVYSGRTENLTTSKALSLYYAADKYDFPDLRKECVHFLETSLSTASVYDVVHLATRYEDKELFQTATEFFAGNIHEILATAEWRSFLSNNTDQANELLMNALKIISPPKIKVVP